MTEITFATVLDWVRDLLARPDILITPCPWGSLSVRLVTGAEFKAAFIGGCAVATMLLPPKRLPRT